MSAFSRPRCRGRLAIPRWISRRDDSPPTATVSEQKVLTVTTEELEQSAIGFALVGGYAISQFETRFSTDLVIAPDDYDEVIEFLEARGFEQKADLEVPPEETIYNREIELFERTEGLPHPVGVDVLVNGLGCRQTAQLNPQRATG